MAGKKAMKGANAEGKKQSGGCCGSCCKYVLMPVMVAGVALAVMWRGNPTQQFDRLLILMKGGNPGDEAATDFRNKYEGVSGNAQHGQYDADIANSFYNLATEFYEYGWGDSFHFGYRQRHEGHHVATDNSQTFIAQKLQVGDMDRVLDVGCGIGGPMRGVVKRTGANITGLTINEFQIKRAREITSRLTPYYQARCHFSHQDYLNIKGLEENAYDAAFYMESSLHCENRTQTFSEVYKLLKPGGRLVALEYNTLEAWNPEDPVMKELMTLHLRGNGAARTPTIQEDLKFFRDAGFEVREHFDLMAQGEKLYGDRLWPWWEDLMFNYRLHIPASHPWIRGPLPHLLRVLSKIGLVPPEVPETAELMNEGGDGLAGLGKLNAITPQYYVLAVKPMN